jgi:uncharacterized paraquat-inducible protein A
MKTAKIYCPACEQPIEIPNAQRGRPLKCPACEIGFIVPGKPSLEINWGKAIIPLIGLAVVGLVISAVAREEHLREGVVYLLLLILGLIVYFVPAIMAQQRRHPNFEAIAVLNLVAGWTVLGWVVALVWAHTKKA